MIIKAEHWMIVCVKIHWNYLKYCIYHLHILYHILCSLTINYYINCTIHLQPIEGGVFSIIIDKTVNGEEDGILILIFDSIDNANKANETTAMLYRWGRAHAPETDTIVYGIANNIIWAGSSQAKSAAGIF